MKYSIRWKKLKNNLVAVFLAISQEPFLFEGLYMKIYH